MELGPEVGNERIVRSGLHGGDRIVVDGLQKVRPGMPVVPQTEGAAHAENSGETSRMRGQVNPAGRTFHMNFSSFFIRRPDFCRSFVSR